MAEKKTNRRAFLGKIILGSTGLAATPLIGGLFAGDKTEENESIQQKKNMNPIKKIRALGFQWETLDPFLFCVHHEDKYPKGNSNLGPAAPLTGRNLGNDFHLKDGWRMYHGTEVPGFPGHPHRGFETLTVVRKGMVDHADSAGGAGRYGNGDLQWMTAGSGLMHSEMFPLLSKEKENPLELFQIWLNLPRKSKMSEPQYKMFWGENIPKIKENGVLVEVLAGQLLNNQSPTPPSPSWAADSNNHVGVFNILLEPNATFSLPAAGENINRTLYFYEGSGLKIAGKTIPDYHGVDVEGNMDIKLENGAKLSKVLVLQGRPINEPVVQHGPFVMNSRQEIQQAFMDYQQTQFGGWPWKRYDQVHDPKMGRFAKYTDGKEEFK
jgi:redox-sensitive bicupin YhaK (pirin superfamily)